jgi:Icc-related predicted phosphoesterase
MLILSDIHADTNSIMLWAKSNWMAGLHNEKYCIQLGDFGFWFSNQTDASEERVLDYLEKVLEDNDKYLFTILGNHDCWPRYLALETCEDFGFKTWKLRERIHAIQPGEIVSLEGKTFLCIGGADSHDKEWRAEYEKLNGEAIWWEEETITNDDIVNALKNLHLRNCKVDYVLTHCPPETFVWKAELYPNPIIANSEKQLEKILNVVKFKHWYCGHVHMSANVTAGKKEITSLKIDDFVRI